MVLFIVLCIERSRIAFELLLYASCVHVISTRTAAHDDHGPSNEKRPQNAAIIHILLL